MYDDNKLRVRLARLFVAVTKYFDIFFAPEFFMKASVDTGFDYAMGMKSGDVIYFGTLTFKGFGWVLISDVRHTNVEMQYEHRQFDRGLQIRMRDIVWIADAPHGS